MGLNDKDMAVGQEDDAGFWTKKNKPGKVF
jgi:hypothetical protein